MAGFVGCASSSDDAPASSTPKVETQKSSLARDTAPNLSDAEKQTLSASQADFALSLYHSVSADLAGQSVFISPHSASLALGMTYSGARGTTASEMKSALRLNLPDERVPVGFNYLDLQLASRGQGAVAKDGKPFRLNIANALFGQSGINFEKPFLDTLATNYGAGINVVDFKGNKEGARKAINGWVEEKTENRIKDLLKEDAVSTDTRFVLVNAVYFNASWQHKFEAYKTYAAPFTKLDGTTTNVSMMSDTSSFLYAKGDGYQAVSLPYQNQELSMLVIVPDAGTFATFDSGLTGAKVLDIASKTAATPVRLSYPKHHLEGDFDLVKPLESLGMRAAFGDGAPADFTGILTSEPLQITGVVQKTFLDVDEDGTEAAAATGVVGGATSAPQPPDTTLTIDRPFIEAIIDNATKTLVFVGRIVEPQTK